MTNDLYKSCFRHLIHTVFKSKVNLNETKKDKFFFKQLCSCLLFRSEKVYTFLELVEHKPHYLPPASKVCRAWRQ